VTSGALLLRGAAGGRLSSATGGMMVFLMFMGSPVAGLKKAPSL